MLVPGRKHPGLKEYQVQRPRGGENPLDLFKERHGPGVPLRPRGRKVERKLKSIPSGALQTTVRTVNSLSEGWEALGGF